jgi:hypothetical protein
MSVDNNASGGIDSTYYGRLVVPSRLVGRRLALRATRHNER